MHYTLLMPQTVLTKILLHSWTSRGIEPFRLKFFIAGFHSRLGKISKLKLYSKLQGHLLLRQACLDAQTRTIIVGGASGSYEVRAIANSLRQAFRNNAHGTESATNSSFEQSVKSFCKYCKSKDHDINDCEKLKKKRQRENSRNGGRGQPSSPAFHPTFFTYATRLETPHSAIVDTGAVNSIVGKETLDDAMRELGWKSLPNGSIRQQNHRFGDHSDKRKTIANVIVPFHVFTVDNKPIQFNVSFDVIPGKLPFPIGLPSLRAMRANVNCASLSLSFSIRKVVHHVQLLCDGSHISLPIKKSGSSNYTLAESHYQIDERLEIDTMGAESNPSTPSVYTLDAMDTDLTPSSESNTSRYELDTDLCPSTCLPYSENVTYAEESVQNKGPRQVFSFNQLQKLHLQLKHGSYAEMRSWLVLARKWHTFIEGVPVLHIVDKCTTWSEASVLSNRSMEKQISVFQNIQVLRHGPPLSVQGDNEYNNSQFKSFFQRFGGNFTPIAANDHQSNGAVEGANRILKSYFQRIRSMDQKSCVQTILLEALFGKNICVGTKGTSAFQLLFGRSPTVMQISNLPAPTLSDYQASQANHRISKMLRSRIPRHPSVIPGDFVYFWRDGERWVGPAKVISIEYPIVTIVHNSRKKSADISRIRKTVPPPELIKDGLGEFELDLDQPCSKNNADQLPIPMEDDSLPSPMKDVSPPSPMEADSLPSPMDADLLPSPMEADSLPSPMDADSLPSPMEADSLPSPMEADSLPSPMEADSLPSPMEADSLPSPMEADSLLSPAEADSLPSPM